MACSACAKRRKALLAKRKQKQAQGKPVQAAALGAVLAVSEAAGKVMGIHGEVEDGRNEPQEAGSAASPGHPVRDDLHSGDVGGSQGAEPDR